MAFMFPIKTVNDLIKNDISSIPLFVSYPDFLTMNILDILLGSILVIISLKNVEEKEQLLSLPDDSNINLNQLSIISNKLKKKTRVFGIKRSFIYCRIR